MERKTINNKFFVLAVLIFIAAALFGYYTSNKQLGEIEEIRTVIKALNLQGISPFWLFVFIFFNNAFKAFLVIILGFIFGLVPFYFLYVNGVLLGATIWFISKQAGVLVAVAGLLPHGIIEIPAFLITVGYGFWLGGIFFRRIKQPVPLRPAIRQALGVYVKLILPMLFVAALIEAYLTPILLNYALGK